MTLLHRARSALADRGLAVSPLGLASLAVGLIALLGLGWDRSPLRLHAPGAAVWATVAAVLGLIELSRAPRGSERRFIAAVALSLALVALVEAVIVIVSFAPCGSRCL
jgi:hypothetical protein